MWIYDEKSLRRARLNLDRAKNNNIVWKIIQQPARGASI